MIMKKPHFLSSTIWQKFQDQLKRATFFLEEDDFQALAILENDRIKKIYCPYGPFIKKPNGFKTADQNLTKIAKEQKAIMIRVEPTGDIKTEDLENLGYHKVKSVQPELTLIIDLTPTEEEILAQMNTSSRRYYRKGFRQNLEFAQSNDQADLEVFLELLKQVSINNKAHLHKSDYLRKQFKSLSANNAAKLFVVRLDGEVIAGSIAYDYNGVRHYGHAAADYQHRKLNAGIFLAANMILDAKKQGFKQFDFWGITDSEDSNHPWFGFTKFKRSFGGKERRYLGTWEKPVNKPVYNIINLIKKLR